jgi:uncharacterized membrane protein
MSRVTSYLYDDRAQAHQAVTALESAGFSDNEVSIVSRAADGTVTDETSHSSGAATGAEVGGIVGVGAGILTALGVMAIPGIGPLVGAGMLATTIATGTGGVLAGGLVGALTDFGIDEADADVYAEGIRRGSSLVTVTTSDDRLSQADGILRQYAPVDTVRRRDEYSQAGWRGSSENANFASQDDENKRNRSGTYR